jgi:voltage-gated potassium channel
VTVATRIDARFERWYERLTLVRAISTVLVIAIVLVLVAGALERIVEPDTFTSIGVAYWWAVATVTTVGYGDVVPEDPAGRVVASMLMLTGLALIPTLTSVIVSTLIAKHRQEDQERLEEMMARLEEHLDRIERER